MNTTSFCSKQEIKKGPWSAEEDQILINYVQIHGTGKWQTLSTKAGLSRGGKSCRLRWLNYLRPGIVRGNISKDEEDLIVKLQSLVGNRWSLIAKFLPGRTDNEIKNYWNTNIAKQLGYAKRPSTSTKKIKSKAVKKKQVQCDKTSEMNFFLNEGSYHCQMVHDHDNGQCSNDNLNINSTVGSALEKQEVDHDLLRFLMECDMNNFNYMFNQELMTDHHVMMNPRNDQFPFMVEEDEALNVQNVVEPLVMSTNGNGDQIQIENEVNVMMMKNSEVASMEDPRMMNKLNALASFLDVEYELMGNI